MRPICAVIVTALLSLPAAFAAPPQTVVLEVENMTCAVCPITVRKSLEQVPGVSTAQVRLKERTATVSFDPEQTSAAALMRATANAGFPSRLRE